jgi:hydroxymethylbilane synthase
MNKVLRIATRQSPLALWQAEHVAQQLQQIHAGLAIELVPISTQGDEDLTRALAEIGGKGLFVKALQYALLQDKADIAVHCIKDMSVHAHQQLTLTAVLEREDVRDVFISPRYATLADLPKNAHLGTASPRRQSLIKSQYPYIETHLLRGNVNTRLAKCKAGEYDGIILAAAGLKRLGMHDVISAFLDPTQFIPAIGQGALGIECRQNDTVTKSLVAPLHHIETAITVETERCVNRILGGDCYTPIGAYATLTDKQLHLHAFVGSTDGKQILHAQQSGPANDPAKLGKQVAQNLLSQGAESIIKKDI